MKGQTVKWGAAVSVAIGVAIVSVDDPHAAAVALGVASQIIGYSLLAAVLVGALWSMIQRKEP